MKRISGQDLFDKYIASRDFSGSEEDEYAQTLMTIFSNIVEEIFPLLEEAERLGKKVEILTGDIARPLINDELTSEEVGLV